MSDPRLSKPASRCPPLSAGLPDPLPWAELARPLTRAEDALARLDERLRTSPVRDGWIARTHFADAAAALWLEGELVHLEDLVLHDAGMDIRTPTHELTRAHTVLRGAAVSPAPNPAGRCRLTDSTRCGAGQGRPTPRITRPKTPTEVKAKTRSSIRSSPTTKERN